MKKMKQYGHLALVLLLATQLCRAQQAGKWEMVQPEKHDDCTSGVLRSDEDRDVSLVIVACVNDSDKTVLEAQLKDAKDGEDFRDEQDRFQDGKRVAVAGVELRLTFDSETPIVERWFATNDGGALKGKHPNAALTTTQFFDKLSTAKKLRVDFATEKGARKIATFQLDGAAQIIQKLCGTSCGLRN
jgi:hypothetical protein